MHPDYRQQLVIFIIILAYLFTGTLYAVLTPAWQVPDEPAHYNYVRQVAGMTLPVIEPGDYDQIYLDKLKSERFPPDLPIEMIQYEDHQPPLFYVLAIPVYWAFNGALIPLRLFSLALGAGVIFISYAMGKQIAPNRPLVWLSAAAFIAFLPQHIAMMAGVNNDSLSELLLAAALLGAVYFVESERPTRPECLGLLLGAIFLTKSQAYVAAPVLALGVVIRWRRQAQPISWLISQLFRLLAPALLIGIAWWGRNLTVYGDFDWMGLSRHDEVVFGQPTTAGWISEHGALNLLSRFAQFSFQSFWGMFGWMGVVMDRRVYQALVVMSTITAVGIGWAVKSWRPWESSSRPGKLLLAFSVLLTCCGYLWYNLKFVQHQGRYLFPALIPIALGATIGWEQLATRPATRSTAVIAAIGVIVAAAFGYRFLAAVSLGSAGALWLFGYLPARFRWLVPAAVISAFWALGIAALFFYIIPALA